MLARPSRKTMVAVAGSGSALLLAITLSLGPLVRSRLRAIASTRHCQITVGTVFPSWHGFNLRHVHASLDGLPGVDVQIDGLAIDFSWAFRPDRIDLGGGTVTFSGPATKLRADFERWRESQVRSPAPAPRSALRWTAHGINVLWNGAQEGEPRASALGVDLSSSDGIVDFGMAAGDIRLGVWSVSASKVSATFESAGRIRDGKAAAIVVGWAAGTHNDEGASPANSVGDRAEPGIETSPSPANAPISVALPDLSAAHTRIGALSALLVDRIALGAEIGVDALSWRLGKSPNTEKDGPHEPVPTLGPGPAAVIRSPSGIDIRFSADPHEATTPLTIRISLPTDGSDPGISLDGGPVSLAALGLHEGTAGLVDVHDSAIEGRARAILAADGSALTFDGDVGTHGLSFKNARIAPDAVKGLELHLRARGVLSSAGQLRLDDFGATVGAITLNAAGQLEDTSDHLAGHLRFDSPTAGCQALLVSLPAGLLPDLQGTKVAGTFGARGQIAFDSRTLDSMQLEYAIDDGCRMVEVPSWMAREQFEHAFPHRIYLPDGSTAEQTTGPGTSNWTPIDDISPYMQVAVITTEDGAFRRHHGFNQAAIRASLIANIKARRFVRGASTITMQLAKNLFLSRNKTLARKIEEVVLTEYLEDTFSKDELMELYLNVIEFGPMVYGITAAADYYFGRTPAELDLAECLFLSSLLPAPRRYSAVREKGTLSEGWMRTLHVLMEAAHRGGRITDAELAEAESESVVFWTGGERPAPRAAVQVRPTLDGDDNDDGTTRSMDSHDGP